MGLRTSGWPHVETAILFAHFFIPTGLPGYQVGSGPPKENGHSCAMECQRSYPFEKELFGSDDPSSLSELRHLVTKSSSCHKQGEHVKAWKSRWMQFRPTIKALRYLTEQGGEVRGKIFLDGATPAEPMMLPPHQNCLKLTTRQGRVFVASFENETLRDEWIQVINECIAGPPLSATIREYQDIQYEYHSKKKDGKRMVLFGILKFIGGKKRPDLEKLHKRKRKIARDVNREIKEVLTVQKNARMQTHCVYLSNTFLVPYAPGGLLYHATDRSALEWRFVGTTATCITGPHTNASLVMESMMDRGCLRIAVAGTEERILFFARRMIWETPFGILADLAFTDETSCTEARDESNQLHVQVAGNAVAGPGVQPLTLEGLVPPQMCIAVCIFDWSRSRIPTLRRICQEREEARRRAHAEMVRRQEQEEARQRAERDALRACAMKSCARCSTSGANIYVCPDCRFSYCTNCDSNGRGVNVCPRCGSYKGTNSY
eukprot:gnl/Trimastix_PCT/2100.p1 GENE.gnl/Trimastix_PCT/2100~~gnl/Trimastix_PCT/2100.p1  ORF type:complete len:489 (-),score=94.68 gnl/Trimastix_PCT/2100:20-1486(-)